MPLSTKKQHVRKEIFVLHLLVEICRFTSLMAALERSICNDKIDEATSVKVKHFQSHIRLEFRK